MSTAGMRELTHAECLELLENSSYVGRVGFVADGHPVILPVNYIADRGAVVFCTRPGSKLSAARDGVAVAFEVDMSAPLEHSGWSVLVQGTASEITDENDLERFRRGPLRSWAYPRAEHWVRISIDAISGRRLIGH